MLSSPKRVLLKKRGPPLEWLHGDKPRLSIPDRQIGETPLWREKTSFASNASGDLRRSASWTHDWLRDERTTTRRVAADEALSSLIDQRLAHPAVDRMRFLFTMSDIERLKDLKAARTSTLPAGPRPNGLNRPHGVPRSGNETDRFGRNRKPPRNAPAGFSSWWSQTGSNRRPHACKARALPTELWPRKQ